MCRLKTNWQATADGHLSWESINRFWLPKDSGGGFSGIWIRRCLQPLLHVLSMSAKPMIISPRNFYRTSTNPFKNTLKVPHDSKLSPPFLWSFKRFLLRRHVRQCLLIKIDSATRLLGPEKKPEWSIFRYQRKGKVLSPWISFQEEGQVRPHGERTHSNRLVG